MKIVLTLSIVLLFFRISAQENNTLKELNLKGDVVKITENGFRFDEEKGKYVVVSYSDYEFSNGLLTLETDTYEDFLSSTTTKRFIYNSDNSLKSVVSKSDFFEDSTVITYEYLGGKPNKKVEISSDVVTTFFEYSDSGNLKKKTQINQKGETVNVEAYTGDVASGNYQTESNGYSEGETINHSIDIYKNGHVAEFSFESDIINVAKKFFYDSQGNEISAETAGETVTLFDYVYDSNQNYIKMREFNIGNGILDIPGNVFYFREILYADGSVSGSYDFDAEFVKKYDTESSSYEVDNNLDWLEEDTNDLLQLSNDLLNSLNLFTGTSGIKIYKDYENKYKAQLTDGTFITENTLALNSTNKLDLMVYYKSTNTTGIVRNFYSDELAAGNWYNLEPMFSETGIFWIMTNEPAFYLVQNGETLNMDYYKLVKIETKEDDFIVTENGVAKYILRDLNYKDLDTFYPLELLEQ